MRKRATSKDWAHQRQSKRAFQGHTADLSSRNNYFAIYDERYECLGVLRNMALLFFVIWCKMMCKPLKQVLGNSKTKGQFPRAAISTLRSYRGASPCERAPAFQCAFVVQLLHRLTKYRAKTSSGTPKSFKWTGACSVHEYL